MWLLNLEVGAEDGQGVEDGRQDEEQCAWEEGKAGIDVREEM